MSRKEHVATDYEPGGERSPFQEGGGLWEHFWEQVTVELVLKKSRFGTACSRGCMGPGTIGSCTSKLGGFVSREGNI